MPSSYSYTSGQTRVVCSVLLTLGRYSGKFVAATTAPNGRPEVHERTCPGWFHSIDDALTGARAMAESIYPPTPQQHQQSESHKAQGAPTDR